MFASVAHRTREFHYFRRECVRGGNSQFKHGQVLMSIAARVLFNSDGNGKYGRLKYVFFQKILMVLIIII